MRIKHFVRTCFSWLIPFMLIFSAQAQELQVSVSVSAPAFGSDKAVFEDMQKNISQYFNQRIWTNHKYLQYEKIKANIVILISDRPQIDYFKGTLQLRVTRPVYNSTYETVLANIQDKNFDVRYVQYQTLEFSENSYIDNLTSILNFYANIILGIDYASFSPNGGLEYFQKAQSIVSLAANSKETGWQSMDGMRSRYWLAENMINSSYKKIHEVYYQYHRLGLDQMTDDLPKARATVLKTLQTMQKLNLQNPGLYVTILFTDAKQQEIISIFKGAFPNEKQQLIQIMETLDAANVNKYSAVLKDN
ncbi:MAG: DUF4835 family protein [Bacteroidia bacterium]|nr:DUF4835 family protein [Bacteroidia bacterium]